MTTVRALNEDLLYTILFKCSSSIDMWHFLLALDYELPRMMNLRAFWSHIRLSSLHNNTTLLSFIQAVAMYCVDLRIDNLNWMVVADKRRVLSYFRLLVSFHSGNVSLSRSTLINDIKNLFPFLKYVTLLISIDSRTLPSSTYPQTDDSFQEIWTSLNEIHQLEHLSLILQDKNGGCLSNSDTWRYFRLVCQYVSKLMGNYKLISIEENGYEFENRCLSIDADIQTDLEAINISLLSTLKHLIISFRPVFDLNLTLQIKDSTKDKLQLETLVLPCVPSIDILGHNQLKILDINYVNTKDRTKLTQLDDILRSHRSLRNISINLADWQLARLSIVSRKEDNRQITTSTTQFSSVFENCFDQDTISEDEEKPIILDQSSEHEKTSTNLIDEFSLEFLDENQLSIFQLSLNYSWINQLTNLNLTGIHCHSVDFQLLFDSLHLLQSLSLSPCLLLYLDQFQCHCQKNSTLFPLQIHSLNKNLLSLNLVCHISNMKQSCSICLEQYKLHSIRHSAIHQYLNDNESIFHYEHIIRYVIRTILQTLDLHHLSIHMPNYELHIDDLDIQTNNHLETLLLDVRIPLTFHTKLAQLYSRNLLTSLRRFLLISNQNFQLTPILLDRFRPLEIIEILSLSSHLNRSTISYLETVLKPNHYPNLKTFRFWIGSVDANHLLKHLHKTIRLAFGNVKPGFQFDVSIMNGLLRSISSRKCILYDHTHEIHRDFHSLPTIHCDQLSVIYPKFLNSQPLYSEQIFDK